MKELSPAENNYFFESKISPQNVHLVVIRRLMRKTTCDLSHLGHFLLSLVHRTVVQETRIAIIRRNGFIFAILISLCDNI